VEIPFIKITDIMNKLDPNNDPNQFKVIPNNKFYLIGYFEYDPSNNSSDPNLVPVSPDDPNDPKDDPNLYYCVPHCSP